MFGPSIIKYNQDGKKNPYPKLAFKIWRTNLKERSIRLWKFFKRVSENLGSFKVKKLRRLSQLSNFHKNQLSGDDVKRKSTPPNSKELKIVKIPPTLQPRKYNQAFPSAPSGVKLNRQDRIGDRRKGILVNTPTLTWMYTRTEGI